MKNYHKTIVFTKVPLIGAYRYKDEFQIYPCDLEGTPNSELQRQFPVILEYYIDEHDNKHVPEEYEGSLSDLYTLAAATLPKIDQILNLLTLISNHLFFKLDLSQSTWGIPLKDGMTDVEINASVPHWCMSLFHWQKQPNQLKITEFSDISRFEDVFLSDFKSYYMHDPNLDYRSTEEVTLPDHTTLILDKYYELEKNLKPIVDTAISHVQSSVLLNESNKTMSMIASFTAIETMVNLEFSGVKVENCKECGQPMFKVSNKYRDFLFKYIGESKSNKKKFSAYYSLRSKIVHTGEQLKTEVLFNEFSQEEIDKEVVTRIEILQLGKLSVINWLITKKK